MLENLLNLVRENAGDAVINNNAIPNEKNEAVVGAASDSIVDYLKNMLSDGGVERITSFLGGGAGSDSGLNNKVVGDLMEKFGLDSDSASGVVSQLIPSVMSQFTQKINDPNDSSFELSDIVSSLSGGSGALGGMMDSVKGLFGK